MADNDGDSQMVSSPEDSDVEVLSSQPNRANIQTPLNQTAQPSAALSSPPDSQHRNMPTTAAGSNANGKRPINTISNGTEDDTNEVTTINSANVNGKARQEFPTETHERSGYSWNRTEDKPGYSWLNKKAVDEYRRAEDALVHREYMIKGKW